MTQDMEDEGDLQPPTAVTEAMDAVTKTANEAMQKAADLARDAQAGAFDMGEQSRSQMQTWTKTSASKGQAMLTGLRGNTEALRDGMASSFTATTENLVAFNVAALEAMRANSNASFDLWTSLAGARTMSDVIALNAGHMRKQMETVAAQTRTLSSLAQRIAGGMAEPIRSSAQKIMRPNA